MADSIESALLAMARGEPMAAQQHLELSDLSQERMAGFRTAWRDLGVDAQLSAIDGLAALSRSDLRVDFGAIFRDLLADASPAVRAKSIRANRDDESERFLASLLRAVKDDPSADVREAAAEALAPFAYRAEVGLLDPEPASEIETALLERVHDSEEQMTVRAAALAGLGYISAPEPQAVVRASLGEPSLELAAVRALGRGANAEWLERLLDYSHRPEPEMRAEAATALGEIDAPEAVPRLIELVDDADQRVRIATVGALGNIGGDDAREALVYAAESQDAATAAAAEEALSLLETFEETMGR